MRKDCPCLLQTIFLNSMFVWVCRNVIAGAFGIQKRVLGPPRILIISTPSGPLGPTTTTTSNFMSSSFFL